MIAKRKKETANAWPSLEAKSKARCPEHRAILTMTNAPSAFYLGIARSANRTDFLLLSLLQQSFASEEAEEKHVPSSLLKHPETEENAIATMKIGKYPARWRHRQENRPKKESRHQTEPHLILLRGGKFSPSPLISFSPTSVFGRAKISSSSSLKERWALAR